MSIITLRHVGDTLGIELPADALARMNLKLGDAVLVSQSPDGSLRVARADPGHEEQMRVAREGMREYAETLSALAK